MESDPHLPLEDRLNHFKERVSSKRFNSCLSEEEISHFEYQFKVRLPEAYRRFLLEVGNGGNGIATLSMSPSAPSNSPYSNLNRSFPYWYAVPFMSFEAFMIWYQTNPKAIDQFVEVATFRKNYYATHREEIENQLTLFKVKTFFEGESFLEDLYEAYLYSPHHRDGTLALGEFGSEERYILVVTGKRRGRVWGYNTERIYPLFGENGPLDFLDWLEEMV